MGKEEAMTQIQTIMVMTVVMIALFLLGVILVIWNPIPERIPQATIGIEGEGDSVVMQHLNGDSFSSDRLVIKVNGDVQPNQNMNFQGGTWPWSTGERIQFYYPSPDAPRLVEIYYLTDKGESLLSLIRPDWTRHQSFQQPRFRLRWCFRSPPLRFHPISRSMFMMQIHFSHRSVTLPLNHE